MKKLGNSLSLEELLQAGVIEYVDVNEENNCLISLNEAGLTSAHTHMEIDPLTILGVVAGLVRILLLTKEVIVNISLWRRYHTHITTKVRVIHINVPWENKLLGPQH